MNHETEYISIYSHNIYNIYKSSYTQISTKKSKRSHKMSYIGRSEVPPDLASSTHSTPLDCGFPPACYRLSTVQTHEAPPTAPHRHTLGQTQTGLQSPYIGSLQCGLGLTQRWRPLIRSITDMITTKFQRLCSSIRDRATHLV